MPTHEYSALQALQLIIRKLTKIEELANVVQAAVDAGRDQDIQAAETTEKGKRRTREYRKTVPYTYDEAIEVALKALEAFFVVQPLCRNSCYLDFAQTAVGIPRPSTFKIEKGQHFEFDPKSIGVNKSIQIELRTETQLLPETQSILSIGEVYELEPTSPLDVQAERNNLDHLRRLLSFDK